ncbi:hypothetical protein [Acrocarpospora corrugata]|nr:hypothetical protein [Acrocarpospora corrugata]
MTRSGRSSGTAWPTPGTIGTGVLLGQRSADDAMAVIRHRLDRIGLP